MCLMCIDWWPYLLIKATGLTAIALMCLASDDLECARVRLIDDERKSVVMTFADHDSLSLQRSDTHRINREMRD